MEAINHTIGIISPGDFVKQQPFGGAQGFLQNILPEIRSPVVIYGIGINGTPSWHPAWLRPNVKFISISETSYPSKIPMRLKAFLYYLRYRERILRSGIDILYVHSPESALPFLFCNRHVCVVFHQHGSGNPVTKAKYVWARNKLVRLLFDMLLKVIHQRCDWVIVIDRLCFEQVRSNRAENKVSLLMNAVDTKKFFPKIELREEMRGKHGIQGEDFIILFAGRLEEIKRIDRIVDAMTLLKENRTSYHLYVAGEGSQKKWLENYVEKQRLQGLVTFLGYVPQNELTSYYNMADVLVLSSEMEGTPMVVLEALACGTPVVAHKVGGIGDLITNAKNGFLVQEASKEKLMQAIMKVKWISFDRDDVANSVERWSTDRFVVKLNKIFESVMETRKRVIDGH